MGFCYTRQFSYRHHRQDTAMLTDTNVKTAKPKERDCKLADEKGMYLLVTKAGGKLWRLDYRFDGKRKTLAMGHYPAVSLKQARERRDEARKLLADGVDPGEARKEAKAVKLEAAANTFGTVAEEWFEAWKEGKAVVTVRHMSAPDSTISFWLS